MVELDPELFANTLVIANDPVHADRRERPRLLLDSHRPVAITLARDDRAGDVRDVFALIAVGRQRDVLAEQLPVANGDGQSEHLELRPGVLDVELPTDFRAEESEDTREDVTERSTAGIRQMQWAGRIRRDEFHL